MAPPTSFEKDESDREYIRDNVEFLQTQLDSHKTTKLTKIQVKQFLDQVEDTQQSLSTNHSNMRHHAPKSTDMKSFVADYFDLRNHLSRLFSSFHGLYTSFPADTATPLPSSTSTHHPPAGIKLPPLELPKFSGNLQEWVSFRDMFKTTIDASSLSKVEKLTQLKALLTGEAARQIRSLVLSESNYDIAWKALQDRYENNRELLFSIMRRMFSQTALSASSSIHLRSLIDTTKECVRQLEVLSLPTDKWDAMLIYLLFSKLDPTTRELWEQSLPDTNIPSLTKLFEFLEQRARALAAGSHSTAPPRNPPPFQRPPPMSRVPPPVRTNHMATRQPCKLGCTESHLLFRCLAFRDQPIQVRTDTIRRLKLCHNCLSPGHAAATCTSTHRCKICNQAHHTMLHQEPTASQDTLSAGPPQQTSSQQYRGSGNAREAGPSVRNHFTQPIGPFRAGVLATATVTVFSAHGNRNGRSLLDAGATNTSITEDRVRELGLPVRRCNIPLTGLDETTVGIANYITTFQFSPWFNSNITYTTTALVVKSIGGDIPSERLNFEEWDHVQGLQLADPQFHIPARVDILFGADIFWQVLGAQKIEGNQGNPFAVSSTLGWLIAGENNTSTPIQVFHLNATLDEALQRFWEQETVQEETVTEVLSPEEVLCETHFKQTHTRNPSTGSFTVSLPFKTPKPSLGHSRQLALRRFLSMERRFTNPKSNQVSHQWEEYKKFMREYEELGHMVCIPEQNLNTNQPVYYIPHHSVLKESSTTTKLRVVFDASASTTTGNSLNDCLMVGPKLQDKLSAIIARSRFHKIMFTSDITKMYRMIALDKRDWNYQRVFWREHPSQTLQEYWLTTVTYGTTSAPHHAVRCLQQLARDEKERFPEASRVALTDFYVDDNCSGTDNVEDAIQLVQQLIQLARAGGFELRKWTSNNSTLLSTIPEELREKNSLVEMTTDNTVKTLGVFWNTSSDSYHFQLNLPPAGSGKNTKRKILSDIAKIFDPLGWLAPVIIVCKIFMQELWSIKLGWDDELPAAVQTKWNGIRESLSAIETITIPRCVNPTSSQELVLVGCCDASIKAMSACIYVMDPSSNQCRLLESRTKVAPIKHVTLPRLELNSAVLLSELIKSFICK